VLKRHLSAACVALCACGASAACAQGWPVKPIRIISPFPPGGGIDASARIVAQALTEQLSQSVVVENKSGASGRIGTEIAAKAVADGYTLLLGSIGPNAIIPSAAPKLPYDSMRDFAPVSLVASTEYTLVVHPNLPVQSLKDLLQLAKAKPKAVTYASSGNLLASHLAGELLNITGKVHTVHVAYKGTGPAAVSVITGETVMAFGSGPSTAAHVSSKRLRAIATTGRKRATPDLPTMSETLPGYEVTQWYGVLVPAGTPQSIVAALNKELLRAVETPRIAQQFASLGAYATSTSPQEFTALIKADLEKWGRVIRAANIHID
jgi:tripartite-type tricarboxylate transporter receptor subunit TctC